MSEPLKVFSAEDRPHVISIPYACEHLRNTLQIWNIHRNQGLYFFAQTTAALQVNKLILS
jgi:hypothetical protein